MSDRENSSTLNWRCPEHGSFVQELDGSRHCNFVGCEWRCTLVIEGQPNRSHTTPNEHDMVRVCWFKDPVTVVHVYPRREGYVVEHRDQLLTVHADDIEEVVYRHDQ